jgi:Zn-dependent protease with chaperone function
MTFVALAACLSLAAYGAVLVATSPLSLALVRIADRTKEPDARARRLFAARFLPAGLGALVAAGLVLPAFLLLEPRSSGERVGAWLAVLAAASAAVVLAGLAKGLLGLVATRRVVRGYRKDARPLRIAGLPLPAFAVEDRFPLVAVVGSLRPRLYVSRTVLDRCTASELEAIVAHEAGHVIRRDPWRLLLLRACPDLIALTPAAARIERRWADAAEQAADDHASALGPARTLDLASALIRVARLAGSARRELPMTALYRGGGVAPRVARLIERTEAPRVSRPHRLSAALAVAGALAIPFAAAALGVFERVHRVLEAVVALAS